MIREIFRHLGAGARSMVRQPGFSAVVVLTLGLGIGANAAILSVVRAVFTEPMPFEDSQRVVVVVASKPARQIDRAFVTQPDYQDMRRAAVEGGILEDLAAMSNARPMTLIADGNPEHVEAEFVTGNLFSLLGVGPRAGRVFTESDDEGPEAGSSILLSEAFWKRRFGEDTSIIGQKLSLGGRPYTVAGVVGPEYSGSWWEEIDVWLPMSAARWVLGDEYLDTRRVHWTLCMGRLAPGQSIESAREFLFGVTERLEEQFPESNKDYRSAVFTLPDFYFDHVRERLRNAMIGAGLVLLLCCINVASLLLTRGAARQHELAVRRALGATRWTIFRQLLFEGVPIALTGGVVGLLLAGLGIRWLIGLSDIPPATFTGRYFDGGLLLQVFGLAVLTALFFGLVPAIQAFRRDHAQAMKPGHGSGKSRGAGRWVLSSLSAVEVALALAVLVVAALQIVNLRNLQGGNPGYHADNLLTVRLELPRLLESIPKDSFLRELLDEATALPGVEAAGVVGPHSPPRANLFMEATIESRLAESEDAASFRVYRQYVSPGYLSTMGIELIDGREFDFRDLGGTPAVAVVNETLAERAWPGESALNKRLRRNGSDEYPWYTVVGVAKAAKNRGLTFDESRDLDVYMPVLQEPSKNLSLMLRMQGEVNGTVGEVRDLVRKLDPEAPVYDAAKMRDRLNFLAADDLFIGVVLGIFALVALVVAVIGVFGMLSYSVRCRTREFGLRMALGAQRGAVLTSVLGRGVGRIAVGLLLGFLGVYGLTRWVSFDLFEVDPLDPAILLSAAGLLILCALFAVWIPAWRATRVEPVSALRHEDVG